MRRGPCPEPNFKDWQGVTGAVFCGKFEGAENFSYPLQTAGGVQSLTEAALFKDKIRAAPPSVASGKIVRDGIKAA